MERTPKGDLHAGISGGGGQAGRDDRDGDGDSTGGLPQLSHHLGYPPGTDKPGDASNHRNGTTGKTVLTDDGPLRIDVPRDRRAASSLC